MNKCIKCNHIWENRRKKKPKVCPRCKNPNWNKINNKEMVNLIIGNLYDRLDR